jgi:hypothetical protein
MRLYQEKQQQQEQRMGCDEKSSRFLVVVVELQNAYYALVRMMTMRKMTEWRKRVLDLNPLTMTKMNHDEQLQI